MAAKLQTASLETTAKDEIVKSLGELAESISSKFSCGGELSSPDRVWLTFKSKPRELREVVFPNASDADTQQLVDTCSIASFGLGDQQVTDRSYRDALKLDPDNFTTSFQVSNTPILLETTMTMVPDVHCIRAELYKLNIYSTGSFFKAHVDTPRSDRMFGSLVVCLPTEFSGGELVTRHHGREVKFDWSSSPDSPRKTVSWATFFSDVEHEVLPVTQGHRITLTYNLYGMERLGALPYQLPAHDATLNPLYSELRAVLGNPNFMHGGGVLGFASHHTYTFTDLNNSTALPILLKGADRIVYSIAKCLGLSVMVKPIVHFGYYNRKYLLPNFTRFKAGDCIDYDQGETEEGEMTNVLEVESHFDKYITWCQKLGDWHPAGATASYGNEPSLTVYYQAAAILVGIPQWGEYRRECASGNIHKTLRSESARPTLEPGEKQSRLDDKDDSAAILTELCFHGEKRSPTP